MCQSEHSAKPRFARRCSFGFELYVFCEGVEMFKDEVPAVLVLPNKGLFTKVRLWKRIKASRYAR